MSDNPLTAALALLPEIKNHSEQLGYWTCEGDKARVLIAALEYLKPIAGSVIVPVEPTLSMKLEGLNRFLEALPLEIMGDIKISMMLVNALHDSPAIVAAYRAMTATAINGGK